MKATLRQRGITKGRSALYLDYYPPIRHPDKRKLTRREHLKIYVFDQPKNTIEKNHNKETMALAENVRAKRQLEVQNRQYGFISDSRSNENFIDYFIELAKKKRGSSAHIWEMAVRYFEDFAGPDVRFSDLTESLCEDFRDYMIASPSIGRRGVKISNNTALSYFGKFRFALKLAYKAKRIPVNLNELVEPLKERETHREFLTIVEFQRLAVTDCPNEQVKRAALFCGLTGLRFSDVSSIQWSQIRGSEADYYLQFRQVKTAGTETLPISDQAVSLLGERQDPERRVFKGLAYSHLKKALDKWMENAGIAKNITFHSFRHTYATLQLSSGTDIYTVSKMLGHRDLKTTQIYTRVIDDKKREAANRIKLNFSFQPGKTK
ncbi:MAG: site-specific integrase [Daejeonella sp.]|nr:site-specific integrase [Daejeonella sp.]